MDRLLLRTKARLRGATKPIGEAAVGALTVGMLRATRYFDPIKTANLFGRIARSIGPMMREQRIGRANLTAAFPEKSPEEIETILAGVWDNLGRVGAEFAHLDHIWEHDPARPEDSRIEIQTRTHELFAQLRLDGKPALIFASHLGNWELPALAAVAHGLDAAILYRRPNIASADRIIQDMRAVKMGTLIPAGRDAPLKLAEALQKGQHVAMLVDRILPMASSHVLRPQDRGQSTLPGCCGRSSVLFTASTHHPPARPSLRAEIIRRSKPVRDAAGKIDVKRTMQAVTSM
jgi:KDO2-lipid IV(A) lauroyltransferase